MIPACLIIIVDVADINELVVRDTDHDDDGGHQEAGGHGGHGP